MERPSLPDGFIVVVHNPFRIDSFTISDPFSNLGRNGAWIIMVASGRKIYEMMLMQIPGVSKELAGAMINQYGCLENLVWHATNRRTRNRWFDRVEGLSKELAEKITHLFEFQEW